jgi:hypothetical protein
MARRSVVQQRIVDALAELFDARSPGDRFSAQVLVAAVSAMVTGPLVAGDLDALTALAPPVIEHVRRLHDAGLLGWRPVENRGVSG